MKIFCRFLVLITVLALTLVMAGGHGVCAEECWNPPIEFEEDIPIDLTINSSLPPIDVAVKEPDALDSLPDPINQLKENLTNLTPPADPDTPVNFQKERPGAEELIAGTKSGIKSSPALISTGIGIGTGKAKEAIPEDVKVGGKTGISVISSMVGRAAGKIAIRLPGQGGGKIIGPEVTPEQFVATTMMSALIMAFASIFSSGAKYPIFVPLYTRINRDKVLENPTRENIYQMVAGNPGMDLLSIKNALDLSNGVLAYHIHTLERERYLRSIRDGRHRRFYVTGTKVEQGSYMERLILREIENNPTINQSQLARRMNLTRQAVHYHIRKLTNKGMVTTEKRGRETHCRKRDI